MTLTEQWKKGELPEGFYYVDDGAEVTIDYYLCDYWERHFDRDVQQVVAPVPRYEEWKELIDKKYWCNARAKNLLEKNQRLRKWCEEFNTFEVAKENQRLKDVISKMCMELVDPDDDMSNGLAEYFNQDLLLEIHEVLK